LTNWFIFDCVFVQNYFSDPWNVFDFIIVLGSFIDIVYSDVNVIMLENFCRSGFNVSDLSFRLSLSFFLFIFLFVVVVVLLLAT